MDEKLTKDLQNNIRIIREHLCLTEDLLNKDLVFVDKNCTILFLESMVNKEHLQSFVIGPMLEAKTGEIERVVEGPDLKAILASGNYYCSNKRFTRYFISRNNGNFSS